MTLDELELHLDGATCADDVFGPDFVLGFRRLAKACHPDLFRAGSTDAQRAEALFKRINHWKTLVENLPRRIVSPEHSYLLTRHVGAGDLCDVYRAAADPDDGTEYVVKMPRGTGCANLLAKEREVLAQLIEQSGDDLYRDYFPLPVETFRVKAQRINTFVWRDGYHTAEQIRRRYPAGVDARHLAWMFNRVLEAIGYAHQKGWIHGAVLPPHLLFHAESHGLQLIDWIHAEELGTPLRLVSGRFLEWYPQECRERKPATPATDIYLAAKCMVYLAGGAPLTNAWPVRVPQPLQRFWQSCLAPSPAMRPRDAWALHAEFKELLEELYGPPEFCRFEMS